MGITGDWDQRITRRTLLKTGGSFAAGITLAGIASGPAFGQASLLDNPFTLGVASGDPSPTGVVLWTRRLGRHTAADGERVGRDTSWC